MKTQREKTVAMNVRGIPEGTYRKFKITCFAEGKTIQEKVLELIEQASAETIVTTKSRAVINPDESSSEIE